jgi:hypothetical protein
VVKILRPKVAEAAQAVAAARWPVALGTLLGLLLFCSIEDGWLLENRCHQEWPSWCALYEHLSDPRACKCSARRPPLPPQVRDATGAHGLPPGAARSFVDPKLQLPNTALPSVATLADFEDAYHGGGRYGSHFDTIDGLKQFHGGRILRVGLRRP